MMQATLRDTLRFEGVGLHTGAQCAVEVRPANPGEGLTFVLGATRVPATVEYVRDTSRATVLGFESATVSTTEHLLSALFALGVTNAEIHVRRAGDPGARRERGPVRGRDRRMRAADPAGRAQDPRD